MRRSVDDIELTPDWQDEELYPSFLRPHRRAEIIVAAVMHSFLNIWLKRLEPYVDAATSQQGGRRPESPQIDRGRVTEEGAKAAGHLLGMIVRSVDYLPPIELEFTDVIEAILAADQVVVPDDRYDYREVLSKTFAKLGITPPATNMTRAAADIQDDLDYRFINVDALATSHEEVYRFVWQNMSTLDLNPAIHLTIDRVVTSVRSGPYGLVIREIVADYSQVVNVRARGLHRLGVRRGAIDPDTMVQLWGGGVLVFDQFGRLRQHKAKRILGDPASRSRQTRRLRYLADNGLSGRDGSYGASMNVPRGERFASLHGDISEESW